MITLRVASALVCIAAISSAQQALPQAPAAKTFEEVCTGCHDLDTALDMRRTRAEWKDMVDKMADRGATASDAQFESIVDYLSKYFGRTAINKAGAKEIQEVLEISPEQAEAIVRYRAANGSFKDLDALKKVPGLDAKTLDDRRERVSFN